MNSSRTIPLKQPSQGETSAVDFKSLFDQIGAGSLFGILQTVFDQMAIAELEIERYSARFQGNRVDIHRAFVQLRWILKTPVPEAVYRSHVRELLSRVVNDQSLMRGTKAEVLMLLSEASLVAPLGPRRAALYLMLFDELYPQQFDEREVAIQEPWTGSSSEMLEELRHQAKTDRRLD